MNGQSRFRLRSFLASLARSLGRSALALLGGALALLGGALALLGGALAFLLNLLIPIVLLTPLVLFFAAVHFVFSDYGGQGPQWIESTRKWIESNGIEVFIRRLLPDDSIGRTFTIVLALMSGYLATRLICPLGKTYRELWNLWKRAWYLLTIWWISWWKWCKNKLMQSGQQLGSSWRKGVDYGWENSGVSKNTDKRPNWPLECGSLMASSIKHLGILIVLFLLVFFVWLYQEAIGGHRSASAEPIVALPVLFDVADVEWSSDVLLSIDSTGINLDNSSRNKLMGYSDLLSEILRPESGWNLLVVGYASDTGFDNLSPQESEKLNVRIANLRAKAVGEFLGTELKQDRLEQRIQCGEWTNMADLRRCLPYNNPWPESRKDKFAPIERMNQSVMLYVGKGAHYNCFLGKPLPRPCSALPEEVLPREVTR